MRGFLAHLAATHEGQSIMLIGHAATLYTLRHLLEDLPLEETLGVWPQRPWRFCVAPNRGRKLVG
jgi:broad specificity phosphatase PhoE